MDSVDILYSAPDFLVVNKASGVLVHPVFHKDKETSEWVRSSYNADERTLTDLLSERYPEIKTVGDSPETRPGIVHRLDRETSGVMVVARTQKAFDYFKDVFARHDLVKKYTAIVRGVFDEPIGTIDKPISIINGTVKRTVHRGKMPRPSVTQYRVLHQYVEWALVEAIPVTGRTHQIRLHLSSIGHPIAGDVLYGKKKDVPVWAPRTLLHATSLEITIPTGERMTFSADVPADFAHALSVLSAS